jgi:hypothetical protein
MTRQNARIAIRVESCPSVCMSVCPSVWLPVRLSVCLSVSGYVLRKVELLATRVTARTVGIHWHLHWYRLPDISLINLQTSGWWQSWQTVLLGMQPNTLLYDVKWSCGRGQAVHVAHTIWSAHGHAVVRAIVSCSRGHAVHVVIRFHMLMIMRSRMRAFRVVVSYVYVYINIHTNHICPTSCGCAIICTSPHYLH